MPAKGNRGHKIQDEGSDIADRDTMDFVGAGVTVTDDSGKTKVSVTSGGGGEANTSSNVGTGEGLAKAKVSVDLPFKSLLGTANEIVLVGNVNDVTFSLSALVARLATKLDDFGTPDDNTDLDATTSLHGLFAKLDKVKLDGITALAEVNPALISQAEAEAGSATTERIFSALRVKQAIDALGGGGGGDFTDLIPCVLEVPEGTVAFPDIHALATGGTKVSGFVLPDGASVGIINFKCVIPDNLASTPAMKVRIRIMTLTADTAHAIRLTLSTAGIAVNEDADISLTAETEITAEMPDGTETMNEASIEIDLTTDWVANDTVLGQLKRDPTDAVDDYAGDVLVVGIDLVVDRTPA